MIVARSIGGNISLAPEQECRPVPLQPPIRLREAERSKHSRGLIELAVEEAGEDERCGNPGRVSRSNSGEAPGDPPRIPLTVQLFCDHLQNRRSHVGYNRWRQLGQALAEVASFQG